MAKKGKKKKKLETTDLSKFVPTICGILSNILTLLIVEELLTFFFFLNGLNYKYF